MCHRTTRKQFRTAALMSVLLIAVVLCSCGKDGSIQANKYYLSTDDGLDKGHYLEVLDGETMVLHNIDAGELIEAELQIFEQFDGRVDLTDPETGEIKEVVINEASEEEIERYKALRQQAFAGERKFRIVLSGDINELYFEGETISFGEYVPESNTIIMGGKSYVPEG